MINKGRLSIYQNGQSLSKFSSGTYTTGDVLRIGIHDSNVEYKLNGEIIYVIENIINESGYPLLVDTSFESIILVHT